MFWAAGRALGAEFGTSQTMAYRYPDEVTEVLAARAPGLGETFQHALTEYSAYQVVDGTVLASHAAGRKPSAI